MGEKDPKTGENSITWTLDRVEAGAKSKDPTNPQDSGFGRRFFTDAAKR